MRGILVDYLETQSDQSQFQSRKAFHPINQDHFCGVFLVLQHPSGLSVEFLKGVQVTFF